MCRENQVSFICYCCLNCLVVDADGIRSFVKCHAEAHSFRAASFAAFLTACFNLA